jgi:KinB signaling pathway activation protein
MIWTTLAIGSVAGCVIGIVLQTLDQQFDVLGLSAFGYNVFWMLIGGALISLVSQVGFFAYLIIRFILIGVIRNLWTWNALQVIIMTVVLFDFAFFNMISVWSEMAVLVIAAAVAYWKVKLTNKSAFISTLFFMTAGTILEAQPALKLDNHASFLFMLIPLLVCNAWQILILHKVLDNKKEPVKD